MSGRRTILLAALVALLQIGFLSWSIMSRAAVLRDGREVLVKVEPVDPRDLLRGDYVRLGYDFARLPSQLLAKPAEQGRDYKGTPVFVRFGQQPDGMWKPVTVGLGAPLDTPPGADQADIKGSVTYFFGAGEDAIAADYGIERFYLPEGTGLQIEKDMRERPFFVKLAVAPDGTAQIKQFLDGQTVLFEEPLY